MDVSSANGVLQREGEGEDFFFILKGLIGVKFFKDGWERYN